MRTFPAKNGWQDALQKLREENAGLKKQIAARTEMNEGLRDNKRYLENDLALMMEQIASLVKALDAEHDLLIEAREQIAALTAENKKLFEEGTSIMHDQGAENILLKEQIATLIAKRDEGFELAMTESAPDYERVPRLYSLVHHLQAEIEKLKLEMNRMVRY